MSELNAVNSILSSDYRLEIALGDEKTVDVFFVFKNENRCTRIASHKAILSSKSDVFLTMFSDKWKQLDDDITITDATAEHFSQFLQTFYDDQNTAFRNISRKNVREILYLAHKYNAQQCADVCQTVLFWTLNGRNALDVMELAILYDIKELIKDCAFKIAADCYGILETEEFYKCSPNVLKCFLENINEEDFYCSGYTQVPGDICEACMLWAKRRCRELKIDSKNPENIRSQLNGVYDMIPFSFMKRREFHVFLANYADVFTGNEIKAICNMIL